MRGATERAIMLGKVGEQTIAEGLTAVVKIGENAALVVNGKTGDTTYQVIRIDPSTHAVETITTPHHEIHAKSTFHAYRSDTLATADTIAVAIETPDSAKEAHIVWSLYGAGEVTLDILRDVTSYTGGASVTPETDNQRAPKGVSICTVKVGSDGGVDDDLVITGGTEHDSISLGSGNKTAAQASNRDEFIPEKSTITIYRLTAVGNNILCDLHISWYEHTPKGV